MALPPRANLPPLRDNHSHDLSTAIDADASLRVSLQQMAGAFLVEWKRRFQRPGSSPCASLRGTTLTFQVEDALTPVELGLTRTPEGADAVRRNLARHLDQLYPWLAYRVEELLNCYVAESAVELDFGANRATCTLSLRDLPRAIVPESAVNSCEE